MKSNYHLYLGKAGHLIVMSEFLLRGWNVAIPEIDVGDDIFVVRDESGTLRRVQVKTSTSTQWRNGFSARFNLPLKQLRNLGDVPVHYAFIVRHLEQWTKPLIIPQDLLLHDFATNQIGSVHGAMLHLYFSYTGDKVTCSKVDLTSYVANFKDFPVIE